MKPITYTSIIFLLLFNVTFDSFCQIIPKKDSIVSQKNKRVYGKIPKFGTLIDDVIKPIGYVNDYDSLFSADEVYQMDSLLYAFDFKDSIQIVVVTFDTSQIEPSEVDVATKAIQKFWTVGGDKGRGIVIGISKPYRKMRIENGLDIQKFLTDAATNKVIEYGFIPEFKNGHYFKGTWSGLLQLIHVLKQNIRPNS